jgi:hypothetical protein
MALRYDRYGSAEACRVRPADHHQHGRRTLSEPAQSYVRLSVTNAVSGNASRGQGAARSPLAVKAHG